MAFETVTRNAQATQRRVVLADPAALRECADRLEHAARGALAGDSVLCELTPGLTVIFKPEPVYGGVAKVYDTDRGTISDRPMTDAEKWFTKPLPPCESLRPAAPSSTVTPVTP